MYNMYMCSPCIICIYELLSCCPIAFIIILHKFHGIECTIEILQLHIRTAPIETLHCGNGHGLVQMQKPLFFSFTRWNIKRSVQFRHIVPGLQSRGLYNGDGLQTKENQALYGLYTEGVWYTTVLLYNGCIIHSQQHSISHNASREQSVYQLKRRAQANWKSHKTPHDDVTRQIKCIRKIKEKTGIYLIKLQMS